MMTRENSDTVVVLVWAIIALMFAIKWHYAEVKVATLEGKLAVYYMDNMNTDVYPASEEVKKAKHHKAR